MNVPGSSSPLFFQTAAGADAAGGGPIKSVRFNSGDSAYLSRTPSSAGNRKKYTWSTWVKRSSTASWILTVGTSADTESIYFNGGHLVMARYVGSFQYYVETEASFLDFNSWYHIVVAHDHSLSTSTDRLKLYVNGVNITDFKSGATFPPQNSEYETNNTENHKIGRYANAYLADLYFINDQQLDPTSFGAFDSNGVWQASSFSGTFGTNGFHLFDFANESGIGSDSSGNDNDFTANNLVAATGSPQTSAINNVSNTTTNLAYSAQFLKSSSESLNTNQYDANKRAGLFACWMKHEGGTLNSNGTNRPWIFGAGETNGSHTILTVTTSNKLNFYDYAGGITFSLTQTSSVDLADGNWHHILVRWDTTQATSTDRVKIWLDGEQETLSGTFPSQNAIQRIGGNNYKHYLADQPYERKYWDCKYAQVVFLNGATSYTPSDFLEADGRPKTSLSITFTNPSAYLTFSNSSDIGENSSGYGNDWSVNGTPTRETSDTPTVRTSVLTFDNNNSFGNFTVGDAVTQSDDAASGTLYAIASGTNQMTVQKVTGNFATTKFLDGPSLGEPADLDILFDVPTNGTQTDTGAGGEVSGNYATLSPLQTGSSLTLSNGNLALDGASGWKSSYSTIFLPSGKWYAEFTIRSITSHSYGILVGLAGFGTNIINSEISSGDSYAVQNGPGNMKINYNSGSTDLGSQSAYAVGDVLQLAYDADNGKLWFGKNGTYINSGNPSGGSNPVQSSISGTYCFAVALLTTSDKIDCNFGSRAFKYSAPTNFKAVCTTNLPDPSFAEGTRAFKATAYSGTGSTITISTAFQPDLIWTKCRSTSTGHVLQDRVNGITTNYLQTQATDQLYGGTQGVTSTSATGYTLGTGGGVNGSGKTFRTWAWDAGSGTSTATNTVGQRTSTVKVSQEAGISIVKWTGSSGSGGTVGHSLGAAPEFIIAHRLGGGQWPCYTKDGGPGKYMYLNSDIDERSYAHFWGGQDPTSSVFTTGSDSDVTNGNIIAYCFTPIPGFSAMGYFSGNNSTDGPFINTGFAVAWLLTKNRSASGDWHITDIAGSPFNTANDHLASNKQDGESSFSSSGLDVDLLSNGFKIRGTGAARNGNEDAIFYLAFAANPFKANGGLAR